MNKMNKVLFSIVIPSYNRAGIIGKSIQSVLDQSFTDFELIIVDDGSSDETQSVVDSFQDPRISYQWQENSERGRARNLGIEQSSGEYVTFLDSDDLFYPDHLLNASFETRNKTNIFWSPNEEIDQNGNVVRQYKDSGNPIVEDLINKGNIMSCHGVFVRKEVFEQLKFNEERALAGSEDMDLWLRLAARYDIKKLSQVSNALVHHDMRSVYNFDDVDKLIERKRLMLQSLESDQVFMDKYGSRISVIKSQAYSYIALHSAMNPNNPISISLKFFWKSLQESPGSIFQKRFLATVKYLLKRTIARA